VTHHPSSHPSEPRAPWWVPRPSAEQRNLRVSNDERQEIINALITHWSDGRLDEPTFDQRAARARAATTRGDLDDLLVDLPPLHPAPAPLDHPRSDPGRPRPRRLAWLALTIVVVMVVLSAAAHVAHRVVDPGPSWLLIGLIVWLVLSRRHRHHR
jgi:hypothetical protein